MGMLRRSNHLRRIALRQVFFGIGLIITLCVLSNNFEYSYSSSLYYFHQLPPSSLRSSPPSLMSNNNKSTSILMTMMANETTTTTDDDSNDDSTTPCWNTSSTNVECERAFITDHKFGTILSQDVMKKILRKRWRGKDVDSINNRVFFYHHLTGILESVDDDDDDRVPSLPPKKKDYRHVVLTRNLAQSIVSGYLYHKSGRECWLTPYGRPRNKRIKGDHADWQLWVSSSRNNSSSNINNTTTISTTPTSTPQPTSLCSYLINATTSSGMATYIEYIYQKWYKHLWTYLDQYNNDIDNIKFVCYEDVVNNTTQLWTKAMKHLYPGGGGYYYNKLTSYSSPPSPQQPSIIKQQKKHQGGGHSTNPNKQLRQELLQLVHTLDQHLFNNQISQWDSRLQCGAV